jgi:hypothetical protein
MPSMEALTWDDLLCILDTYNSAIFAEQCSSHPSNAAACRKLVEEAKRRGIDVRQFEELDWLLDQEDRP